MPWVPIVAWAAAAALALVVLGYAAFEILTKTRRLQRDVARLDHVRAGVTQLRHELELTQQRVAAARATASGS